MAFNVKKFLQIKRIEDAKEKKKAAKLAAAQAAAAANGNAASNETATRYANGSRTSCPKEALKRLRNKRAIAKRVRLMIARHPDDIVGMKFKVRHICRWSDEMQWDSSDALTMAIAGAAEEWQKEWNEYDEQHKRTQNTIDQFFVKKV